MNIQVIESVEKEGAEWGISFSGNNPEPQDYFKMPDKETAFRLKEYLEIDDHDREFEMDSQDED